jgi:diguanylate cyclase (GGDEF)-like protein
MTLDNFAFTPFAVPLVASAAITLGLGLYTLLGRRIAGAGTFGLVMFGVVEWSLAYALVLCGIDVETKTFWYQFEYFGVATIPTGWFIFALRYTRVRRWLRPRIWLLLAIQPCLILAAVWTNGLHGLMWPTMYVEQVGSLSVLDVTFGPVYWFNLVYSYALVMGGTIILGIRLLRAGHLYSRQAAALGLATVAPLIGSAVYSLGLTGHFDPAPFTFTITGGALFWGFLRFGLLDVVPVARGAVFEAMSDGLLVLDGHGRIVDLNRAAAALLKVAAADAVGVRADVLLGGILGTDLTEQHRELSVGQGDGTRRLDVQVSAVRQGQGELVGHLVVLRDVSALHLSEKRFRAQFRNLPIPTYSWQHQAGTFVLVDFNIAAEARTNGRVNKLLGSRVDELYIDRPQIRADFARCLSEQISFQREMPSASDPERMMNLTYTFVPPDLITVHAEDITERKRAEMMLTHQARHDALTDLPNRYLLSERLHSALDSHAPRGGSMALLLLDLDRFKDVNDTLGHSVGDRLLTQVAQKLRLAVPAHATVARLGGDEFAVLLPGADETDAVAVARAVLGALARPIDIEGSILDVGGSIGIALAPDHGADAETLMRRADVAMYVAKRSGQGYAVYTSDEDAHRPDRLALVAELRGAIEQGDLQLHYQPKIELVTGRIVGMEGLLRWNHPLRGPIPPQEFVALAERTGLITSLSRWVLGAALRQQGLWRADGLFMPVAVNLSMHDLHDSGLPDLVSQLLDQAGLPASVLEVEITESTLMADPERARTALTRLRDLGVRIAVDDFGTGYSSLAYLKELPVNELKIDRSFVRDVCAGGADLAIVESIVDLAHKLGLTVVAEGIEDAATRDVLARLGCDQAQGYYFARPMPADQITEMLRPALLRAA